MPNAFLPALDRLSRLGIPRASKKYRTSLYRLRDGTSTLDTGVGYTSRMKALLLAFALLLVSSPTSEYRNHLQYTRRVEILNTPCTDYGVQAIAQNHAEWMAKIGYIYHELFLVAPYLPSGWYAAGEIVGMGESVAAIHGAFLNSPRHAAVIYDQRWTHMGIGVAESNGTYYISVLFLAKSHWCGVW